jgi:hypothetical protein
VSFTGSISGTQLTVSGTPTGSIALFSRLSGTCVAANTIVTAIGAVTATGAITGTALSVSAAGTGALANGMMRVTVGNEVLLFNVTGTATGPLSVTSDGHGGSLIGVAAALATANLRPELPGPAWDGAGGGTNLADAGLVPYVPQAAAIWGVLHAAQRG